MNLQALIPGRGGGPALEDPGATYDRRTIFRYMDGAGEVYLSFDFRSLLVHRAPGPDSDTLTVELYDMGNSADAFGVFSRNRRGEDLGVGQGSEYRSGYLLFWKDRVFGTIWTSSEGPRSKDSVLELGRTIAERIPADGPLPGILDLLPGPGRIPNSVRYFHRHTDFNEHYFLSDENILDLGSDTEAGLACYNTPGSETFLFVVRYPDETRAASAHERFQNVFLPEARPGPVARIEDGSYAGAERAGRHVVLVFDAPDTRTAEGLLATARGRIQGDAK